MKRRMTLVWNILMAGVLVAAACSQKATEPKPEEGTKEEGTVESGKDTGPKAAAVASSNTGEANLGASMDSGKAEESSKRAVEEAKSAKEVRTSAGSDVATKLHASLMAVAPKGALAVGAADLESLVSTSALFLDVLLGTELSWTDTIKDLSELFKTRLGMDPMELKNVGVIVLKKGPVFLVPWNKPLLVPAGARTKDFEGVSFVRMGPLWVAQHGEWLLAGEQGTLKAQIRAMKGSDDLLTPEEAAIHTEMAQALGQGMLLLTADIRMATAALQEELPGAELVSAGLVLDGSGLRLMAKAPGQSRKLLLEYMAKSLGEAEKAINEAYKNRADLDLAEAAGIVVAYHQFSKVSTAFAPKEKGEFLVFEIVGVTGAVLPIMGVLSAVAIPAFVKYVRRAKTTEAIDQMDKIYKGAMVYGAEPRVDGTGATLQPCQFPPSVKAGGKRCCEYPDGKCPAEPSEWEGPTWSALKFQMLDPHYYRYEFTSEGTGTEAKATVTAYGDLDCDGIESTFARSITMEPSDPKNAGPKATECIPKSGKLFIDNETE